MGKRGFVLSMDLMVAIGVVLFMIVMLAELMPYSWNRYSYVSDALSIIQHKGVVNDTAYMASELGAVLPYEHYNFTLIDFGPLMPITLCSSDADCVPAYPQCVFSLCGKPSVNVQTGAYADYSSDPTRYCSSEMISKGSCKPEGDMARRIAVDVGDDDLVDHFFILRLEVAR